MIILINGTYGVGKTTTSLLLHQKLSIKNFELLNADKYYIKMIKKNNYLALGTGTTPQTNLNFLTLIKNEINNLYEKNIIIDMSITTEIAKKEIYDYISNKKIKFVHFILTANKKNIIKRIKNDENRTDKNLAIIELNNNILFLQQNFKNDKFINTNKKSTNLIVNTIIKQLD